MADFCFQCAIDLYFGPPGDLDGIAPEGMYVTVLCEGCGLVQVDHRGVCVSPDCDHRHGIPSPRSEVYERAIAQWAARSGPLGWYWRLRDRWFGSPWEPGLVHFPGHWPWYVLQFYRAVRDGTQMEQLFANDGWEFELLAPAIEILEKTDGVDDAAGTQVAGEDDPRPPVAGVVRDEDERPVQSGETGPPRFSRRFWTDRYRT